MVVPVAVLAKTSDAVRQMSPNFVTLLLVPGKINDQIMVKLVVIELTISNRIKTT